MTQNKTAAASSVTLPGHNGTAPDADTLARLGATYQDMLGFVPPRIQQRFQLSGAVDLRMVELQEAARQHALYPDCMDQRQVQLIVFGMLVVELSDAAVTHGIAARRAGASWEEMQAVINLAYVFRGVSAANRGAEVLARIAAHETPNDAR